METLADRMKSYEQRETSRRFLPMLPICARMDGRSFSKLTRGLARPYDERFSKIMIEVTQTLVEHTNAMVGYTQSDEITLIFFAEDHKTSVFFDAKIQKMTSILAALTTAKFNALLAELIPELANQMPLFDARVWQVPSKEEALNVLLWRERDAARNSLSMAARAHYSHNKTMGAKAPQLHDMLHEKGINWNDYPAFFKRGTYIQRKKVTRRPTAEELADLPEKHHARQNPNMVIERTVIKALELPPMDKVINRVEVVFEGAEAQTAQ